jgi:hypothetical protein
MRALKGSLQVTNHEAILLAFFRPQTPGGLERMQIVGLKR